MANMKRSAIEEASGASPTKKLHIDFTRSNLEDIEDDQTTAQTPSSSHEPDHEHDPESPITAATTPRARFPSDFKTLACTWPSCPKTFNRPARLRDHLNSHTNSRPFKCPYDACDKDYTVDKHLKQHIKAVHTHERKHVCQREGCGKTFVTGTRLKRHQAVHEGADRFRCDDCGQSFRKKDTLNKHVRKEHQGLAAFPCSEANCTSAFDTKASLKRHRDREHGEPKFWCGECAVEVLAGGTKTRVGFTTELLLQNHLKQEHQNCMFCDFKSASQGELGRHVELYHSGKSVQDRRTEECPYPDCGKRFTNRSNRNNHVRTAHEGFRFVCGEVILTGPGLEGWSNDQGCGDRFCAKARLEDHVRYIHLGQERPKLSAPIMEAPQPSYLIDDIAGVAMQAKASIFCPQCPETFIRYADLDLHIEREHSPEAAFLNDNIMPSAFGGEIESPWPEEMPQEEVFAAEMDYGPVDDGWTDDEANILLLARDSPGLQAAIDPALGDF